VAIVQLTTSNPKARAQLVYQDYSDGQWRKKAAAAFRTETLPYWDEKEQLSLTARVPLQHNVRRVIVDCPDGTTITVQNFDLRHTVKITPQKRGQKGPAQVLGYIPHGQLLDGWAGDGQRLIIEEVPL
jgi:hypothetical protein